MKRLIALMICAVSLGAAAQTGDCSSYMTLTSTPSDCDASGSVTAYVTECDTTSEGSVVMQAVYDGLNTEYTALCLNYDGANSCTAMTQYLASTLNNAGISYTDLMTELGSIAPTSPIIQKLYNGIQGSYFTDCLQFGLYCDAHIADPLLDDGPNNLYLLGCELSTLAGHHECPCIVSWSDSTGNSVGEGFSVSGLPAGSYTASLNHRNGCTDTQTIEVLLECVGCTEPGACNYQQAATINQGCEYETCAGCTNENATNYDSTATIEDGSCLYSQETYDAGVAFSDCDSVYNPDYDHDSFIGINDILGILSHYDLEWPPPHQCGDPLSYQGYDYETVQIGEQCWFAENLRSENYENGDAIPSNLSNSEWSSTTSGAVAVYGEGSSTCYENSPDGDACEESWSLNEYGRIYTWYAVDDARGLCPAGWHVPTDGEWTVMTDHLEGASVAGSHMKTDYGWYIGGNGTNSSGFTGLPGGVRSHNGYFYDAGRIGVWWSSSPAGSSSAGPEAWYRYLSVYYGDVFRASSVTYVGVSVRCIKNAE